MVKVKTAFTVLLMVSLLGIAACSDDDGDEGGTIPAQKRPKRPPAETRPGRTPKRARANPDQDALGSLQREGRVDWRGSFRVHHRRLSLLRRGEIHRWRCGAVEPVGAEVVPLPRRHPDDHLHLDATWRGTSSDWKVVKGLGRFEGLSVGAG